MIAVWPAAPWDAAGRAGFALGLVLLAACFLGLGLAEAWSDSPTFDEPVYVAAGLAEVLHHDVTFNDEHPPLAKVLAVLPVLLDSSRHSAERQLARQ